jgi:hypothetical protein
MDESTRTEEDAQRSYEHKSFEERLSANDGNISIAEIEWGEPQGRELL